jgi:hypothetical protein
MNFIDLLKYLSGASHQSVTAPPPQRYPIRAGTQLTIDKALNQIDFFDRSYHLGLWTTAIQRERSPSTVKRELS